MYLRTNQGRVVLALALAGVLAGCADMDSGWFAKPISFFGSGNLGYSYSQLGETKQERRITADDLVDANGACPRFASPAPAAPASPDGSPAGALGTAAQLGGGIGVGMSECEVVSRIGAPSAVDLGRNPNGDRTAVLTFQSRSAPRHLPVRRRQAHGNGPRRRSSAPAAAGEAGQEEAGKNQKAAEGGQQRRRAAGPARNAIAVDVATLPRCLPCPIMAAISQRDPAPQFPIYKG